MTAKVALAVSATYEHGRGSVAFTLKNLFSARLCRIAENQLQNTSNEFSIPDACRISP
jgi:hypothetical protein